MSSPTQTPDPPVTLENISKRLSELDGRIASLMETYSGLAGELTADQKRFLESVKAKSQSNKPAWIAAIASIVTVLIAAGGSIFTGVKTSQTNAKLTRFTTLQSENAKKELDIYYVAQDQIAELEQAFETFLLEKKLSPQNAAGRLGNDLNRMCIANRFGSKRGVVSDYDDFIFQTIFALEHHSDRWKDVNALREEAKDKCQKAISALNDLEQNK